MWGNRVLEEVESKVAGGWCLECGVWCVVYGGCGCPGCVSWVCVGALGACRGCVVLGVWCEGCVGVLVLGTGGVMCGVWMAVGE